MTEPNAAPGLPRLHTVEEVARALRCTERYVAEQARLRQWPHVRMARGAVLFSDDDVRQVIDLQRQPVDSLPAALSFAPRSAGGRRR